MTKRRVLTDEWRQGPDVGLHTPRRPAAERLLVDSPEVAAGVFGPRLADADRETCMAMLLDTRHRLLDSVTVSVGTLDHTFMSPREIFRDALLANAAAVLVAHNHPSGDPEPSRDDIAVTARLVKAGGVVGIDLLDHLVIGHRAWTSLARRGHV